MTTGPKLSARPTFNHVAMSLPPDHLGPRNRADLVAFYEEVFGWEEMAPMTVDHERLVLMAWKPEQFVFLIADDGGAMSCPRLDHFGLSVATRADLDAIYDRCCSYRERDERVDLIERQVEDQHGVLDLHNFYVGYLLPMMIEVQFFDWKVGSNLDEGDAAGADG